MKFFHLTTVHRRQYNQIKKIKEEEGQWITSENLIRKAAVKHFMKVYNRKAIHNVDKSLK